MALFYLWAIVSFTEVFILLQISKTHLFRKKKKNATTPKQSVLALHRVASGGGREMGTVPGAAGRSGCQPGTEGPRGGTHAQPVAPRVLAVFDVALL